MLRFSLLFVVFIFSSIHLFSQPTIVRDIMPEIGDKYVLYDCDTVGVVQGNSGANINWDFSSLTRLSGSDYMTLLEFIDPAFAPHEDKFPTATIAQMNDTAAVFYRETSEGFFRLGIGALELHEIIASPYDQNLKFPFSFNDKFSSNYKSTIYVDTEEGEMEWNRYGETMVEYDAYGTLKMPAGKQYDNVYRLYYKSTTYDTVQIMEGFPPMIIITEMTNYGWHASTSIQPILTISNVKVSYIGFPSTPIYSKNVTYSEMGGAIALMPPTLQSPANNSVDLVLPVLLEWQAPDEGEETMYHLQVSSNPGFSIMDFEATISATSQNVYELEFGTVYYWRVRSIKGEETSEFSSIWNFKTKVPDDITVPDPPLLISPTNGAVVASNMPTLVWEEAAGVDYSWKIEVATDMNFSDVIFYESPRMTNTFEFDYELAPGNYFWHVQVNNGEAWSEWSQTWYFVVEGDAVLDPPSLLEPADGSQELPINNITFSWEDDEKATIWIIDIAEDENFDEAFISDQSFTNSITLSGFESLTTYYWRVLSTDGVNTSAWSEIRSFTTMLGGDVQNVYSGNMMKISPNPAQDFVQIILDFEGNQNAEFEIRDIKGNLLVSENLGMISGSTLNLERSISNFASGKYFAIVKIGHKTYINPFTITR